MSKAMKSSVFTDPACYPAISLHQPYAGAIRLSGLGYPAKRIETRTTRIHYRGPLVICATAKSPVDWIQVRNTILMQVEGYEPIVTYAETFNLAACAVAIASVVGCRPLVAEDYSRSLWWDAEENARKPRWAWELEDITPLRPFKTTGSQGFFKVERERVDCAVRVELATMFWENERVTEAESEVLARAAWPLPVEQEGGSFAWPLLGWREGGGA